MALSPIQTAFTGGELSPRVRGRIDAELYHRGLSWAENFMVLPQGPLLMRAGSVYAGTEATKPRLIPFRLLGAEEDVVLSLTDGHLKGWTRSGPLRALGANLALAAAYSFTSASGYAIDHPEGLECHIGGTGGYGRLTMATVPGGHRIRLSGTLQGMSAATTATVKIGTSPGGAELWSMNYQTVLKDGVHVATITVDETVTVPGVNLYIEFVITTPVTSAIALFPALAQPATTLVDLVAPWTAAQIPDVQYVAEPAKNKMYFVHPSVAPQVLEYTSPGTWALSAAVFVGKPAAWAGSNWPGVVELHQGRLLLGGTPNEPNTWWGSKSGSLLDFTIGVNAGDAYSWTVSTKGRIRWMQGQKALLLGSDVIEHSAVGSSAGAIITGQSVDVRDESAFGSAAIQAVHLGDQVVFVTRDRRRVRALNYSLNDNAWISRALTFAAEHLTEGLVSEIHYARSPFAMLFLVLQTGEIRACTYDRGEQVLAWWRAGFAGTVDSAAIADSPWGSYLWIAVERGSGYCVEVLPLHESSAEYLDSRVYGTIVPIPLDPQGRCHVPTEHLAAGTPVGVLIDGALESAEYVTETFVVGSHVVFPAEYVNKAATIGLRYTAKAVTLPREVKTGKARDAKIGVLLSNSALPLLNGKRAADRSPATPQDQPEALRDGRCQVGNLGWSDDGAVTIDQDLPFRTEILAVFAVTAVNEG